MMQSVQVIIERLKTNPEDFFGDLEGGRLIGRYSPRFQEITEKLDDLLTEKEDGHVHRLWFLEPEEKEALLAAYKEARRARFEAKTFHQLLTRQEKDNGVALQTRSHPTTGKILMQGSNIIAPQSVFKDEGGSIDAFPMWQGAVPKGEGEPV
jgi:hypothetical protein